MFAQFCNRARRLVLTSTCISRNSTLAPTRTALPRLQLYSQQATQETKAPQEQANNNNNTTTRTTSQNDETDAFPLLHTNINTAAKLPKKDEQDAERSSFSHSVCFARMAFMNII